MLLWRLSGKHHAHAFDGWYGLFFDGRWNTMGHAVTYCATSPALCVLEKAVHIAGIRIESADPFVLDARLFRSRGCSPRGFRG